MTPQAVGAIDPMTEYHWFCGAILLHRWLVASCEPSQNLGKVVDEFTLSDLLPIEISWGGGILVRAADVRCRWVSVNTVDSLESGKTCSSTTKRHRY